jgi:uncharacterized protein (TIGR03083 family)
MAPVSGLGPPVDALPHLAPERAALLQLLGGLDDASWWAPTACPGWSVFDVVAHLAGDDLARLARSRDGGGRLGPRPGEAFPRFIDRINDEWVRASARLSPPLLVDLLAWTGPQVAAWWGTVDQHALGEPVSWASPDPAPVWLDLARDFTEYWAHHQQVRDALGLGAGGPPERRDVALDTYLRGLPLTLATGAPGAAPGATVTFEVSDVPGSAWTATLDERGWSIERGATRDATARARLDADTTWRLATRGLSPERAAARAELAGDATLGRAALDLLSIIR